LYLATRHFAGWYMANVLELLSAAPPSRLGTQTAASWCAGSTGAAN